MLCSKCGKELPEGSKFCLECGNSQLDTEIFCRECGKKLPSDAKFCNECGTMCGGASVAFQQTYQAMPNYDFFAPVKQAQNARIVTVGIKVWCIICIVVNSLGALGNFAFAFTQDPFMIVGMEVSGIGRGVFAVLAMIGLGMVLGHALTLKAKKEGFYIIFVGAVLSSIVNFQIDAYSLIAVIFSAVIHILITWLIIRKSWDFFD